MYDESISSDTPTEIGPICTFNNLEWRADIQAKFGRCFGYAFFTSSIRVLNCELEIEKLIKIFRPIKSFWGLHGGAELLIA